MGPNNFSSAKSSVSPSRVTSGAMKPKRKIDTVAPLRVTGIYISAIVLTNTLAHMVEETTVLLMVAISIYDM
jgi:hypothetical protein